MVFMLTGPSGSFPALINERTPGLSLYQKGASVIQSSADSFTYK
jgi:hypothetical protein